ncbi:hypothetical protein CDD81_5360 [Ophiocordyceps australis]|uniref:Uncharacterized protein n=1 Tax=Ophiocordyceps australis TaxID=1399860 RepID=A0A2C5Y9J3_9HYPO|nr:hypothetical protein CDD81_5360 [Ophiocordyceps australis]
MDEYGDSNKPSSDDGPLPFCHSRTRAPNDYVHFRRLMLRLTIPELPIPMNRSFWLSSRSDDVRVYYAYQHRYPESRGSVAGLYHSSSTICPLFRGFKPHRIIFQIRSKDNGHITRGRGGQLLCNNTWVEASILRLSPETSLQRDACAVEDLENDPLVYRQWKDPPAARQALQERGWDFVEGKNKNLTWPVHLNTSNSKEYRNFCVTWVKGVESQVNRGFFGHEQEFIDLLEAGRRVVLWARAEGVVWDTRLEAATIEIEFRLS